MARSYSTHWFLPRDFASYIARSALRSMLSAVSLLSPNATPMLADSEQLVAGHVGAAGERGRGSARRPS